MERNSSVLTEEEHKDIEYIQQTRKRLINLLTENGNKIPNDNGDKSLLGTLLDGSDRSVYTRAKLRNDKADNEINRDTVKIIAETLRSINRRDIVQYRKERKIPEELSKREFVPGELEIGVEPIPIQQIIRD